MVRQMQASAPIYKCWENICFARRPDLGGPELSKEVRLGSETGALRAQGGQPRPPVVPKSTHWGNSDNGSEPPPGIWETTKRIPRVRRKAPQQATNQSSA